LVLSSCCLQPEIKDGAPKQKIDVSKIKNATPKTEPLSRYGNRPSYVVNGQRYQVLPSAKGYDKKGIGSWYGTKFHGQLTSTREPYDMLAMTAASTDLPLPTYARVTNLENGHHIIVKVNDRGPFDKNRIIDLSYAAAKKLGYANKGTALVRVQAIDPSIPKTTNTKITHQPKLYIQIGAFKDLTAARKLQTKMTAIINDPIRINQSTYNNSLIYRVQIGPISNVTENDRLQNLLAAKGLGRGMTVVE